MSKLMLFLIMYIMLNRRTVSLLNIEHPPTVSGVAGIRRRHKTWANHIVMELFKIIFPIILLSFGSGLVLGAILMLYPKKQDDKFASK